PRSYQLQLVDYVTKQNSIIYLPTGAGKTFVAILALKRFSHEMDKKIEDGGKRAIFMCNTVELARQQAEAVRQSTNLKVGFYVGEQGVDDWSRSQWSSEIQEKQVFVGTAQVMVDMLSQRYLKLSSVSIVIIDECHHATGNHPFREFMRLFTCVEGNTPLPRVVGLTGVLIKGSDLKQVSLKLRNLETTFRGNIVTVSDSKEMDNVMLYSTAPKEFLIPFPSISSTFSLKITVENIIKDFYKTLDSLNIGTRPVRKSKGLHRDREPNKTSAIKLLFNDFIFQMDEYGSYTGSISILSLIVEFEVKKRQAETIYLRSIYRGAINLCEQIRHLLLRNMYKNKDSADDNVSVKDIILANSTPKLQTFLRYLLKNFVGKKPSDICCLVFVERRYTAKCIFGMLLAFIKDSELRDVLVPQFMVGRNTIAQDFENVLERKFQRSAIQEFREGTANLMICSSVLEEGIDVKACNHVLILDTIKTFNMYIQTKGRARTKDAMYIVFASEMDKAKLSKQIKEYRDAHDEISTYLKNRVLERPLPQLNEINNHFRESISPFTNEHGAVLMPSTAIILIHRYCQSLPSDAFGFVVPWINLLTKDERMKIYGKSAENKQVVSIVLPLTSRLKSTIYSDPVDTAKAAKISAAFKACKELYRLGELNNKFLPITLNERVATVADVHFEHWKKYGDDVTAVKRKDNNLGTYNSNCPKPFFDARPRIGEVCYAYEIFLEPSFERCDYSEYMYTNLKTHRNYALLLRNKLPRLAEMPLFCNQGEVIIRVADEPRELILDSEDKLELLHRFHCTLFRGLLRIWQPFFVLDRRSKENSFLVIPLSVGKDKQDVIDWPLVCKFQNLPRPQKVSVQERRANPVPRAEDFEGKIVTQWYSNYEEKRMLVTKVHRNLTPSSYMENNHQDKTYYEFTMSKYKYHIGDIVHKDQFLIEVRELTEQLNFYVQQRGKSSAISKARAKIILIPELCFNFDFPGDLWLKVIFLPSILRRLKYLLHAEELRCQFNTYLGLQNLPLNKDYKPKPVEIDWSLKRNLDSQGNSDEYHEEQRILLDPMPTKIIETSTKNVPIDNLDLDFQEYMKPVDLERNFTSTYSVELAYYHQFTSGYIDILNKAEYDDMEYWTKNQFKMSEKAVYKTKHSAHTQKNTPALMSAEKNIQRLQSESQISILDKTASDENISPAEQGEFLAAITTANSADVFDMERLELLGDSFLKLSTSLYLASKYPQWNEGTLTQVKSKMVSNRNLRYCLSNTDITSRICNTFFTPKYTWVPPSSCLPYNVLALWSDNSDAAELVGPHNLRELLLSEEESMLQSNCSKANFDSFLNGCLKNRTTNNVPNDLSSEVNFCVNKVRIADKVISDTLEALLGVIVKNYGLVHGFRMLEYFGICKQDIDRPLTQLLDLDFDATKMRANVSTEEIDGFLINYEHLQQNLGYVFNDRGYLLQALTHPSYPTNRITGCYQELEFIGDAILDFLISAYIFEHNTKMTPGQLTDLRSALVNNTTLACICVRHKLHLFLLAENSMLSESIANFVQFQESHQHRVTNQVRILLEENDVQPSNFDIDNEDELDEVVHAARAALPSAEANFVPPKGEFNMSQNVDVPKALGDILEALIAAVYLDCRDLQRTWQMVYSLFEPEIKEFTRTVPLNPIRQLNEHKHANPIYSKPIVDIDKVMVCCQFTCLDKTICVYGFGNNKEQAKLASAKHALQKLSKCYS
ncbi:hypothetical protein KR018_005614, partial [Drosophila ironensis]